MEAQERRPEVHFRQIQSQLTALAELGDEKKNRVLGRVSKDTLQLIQNAKEDQWLPISINLELVNCAASELGEEEVYKLGIKSFTLSVNSFMIGPFFRTAINLFKIKPTAVFKLGPQIWRAIHRNCGELTVVEKEKRSVQILLSNLPLEMASSQAYLIGVAGCLYAVLSLSGVDGKVALEQQSEKDRSASFVLSWQQEQKVKRIS